MCNTVKSWYVTFQFHSKRGREKYLNVDDGCKKLSMHLQTNCLHSCIFIFSVSKHNHRLIWCYNNVFGKRKVTWLPTLADRKSTIHTSGNGYFFICNGMLCEICSMVLERIKLKSSIGYRNKDKVCIF